MANLSIPSAVKTRADIGATTRGLITESYPLAQTQSTAIPTSGSANGLLALSMVNLRAGETITNLVVATSTAGSGITFAKMALYNSAGVFLRATSEFSSTLNAAQNVFISVALSTAYPITADGGYYLGFLQWGNGSTGATLCRASTTTVTGKSFNSQPRAYAQVATQTDLAGDVTLADSATFYWLACS